MTSASLGIGGFALVLASLETRFFLMERYSFSWLRSDSQSLMHLLPRLDLAFVRDWASFAWGAFLEEPPLLMELAQLFEV